MSKEFDEFMDNVKAIQQDPFTQFNMYEHKETIASSDTPQNPLSKLTWEEAFKIYGEHQIQMLEISDEEIEEASRQINYGGGSEGWIKDAFKKGAKWYREQLKKK